MNFDFSKFIASQEKVEELVEVKQVIEQKEVAVKQTVKQEEIIEPIEEVKEVVVETTNTKKTSSKLSWEDKIDGWIEEFKGTPKVIYGGIDVVCTYTEDTGVITISNKLTGEEIVFNSEGFFERAVFDTNTRTEKYQIVIDKFKELTGRKITEPIHVEVEEVIAPTVIEETVDTSTEEMAVL